MAGYIAQSSTPSRGETDYLFYSDRGVGGPSVEPGEDETAAFKWEEDGTAAIEDETPSKKGTEQKLCMRETFCEGNDTVAVEDGRTAVKRMSTEQLQWRMGDLLWREWSSY